MQLADLTLFQAVVEVRYSHAYLLWDRSGQLWSDLTFRFAGLRMLEAQPNNIVFRLGQEFELSTRLDVASIIAFRPNRNLKQFTDHADYFLRKVSELLEINEYSRIGCRLIFAKDFPTVQEASRELLASGVVVWPKGRLFNRSSDPIQPEWAMRWEEGGAGVHVRLRVEERKYDFEPPLVWEGAPPGKKEVTSLTFDVDWYTRAPVLITQLSYVDWIKQCIHAIHRDSDAILSGQRI
ncbi:MAG: hypothetical protein ACKV22_24080 [Bryobacteraceae bacterium]